MLSTFREMLHKWDYRRVFANVASWHQGHAGPSVAQLRKRLAASFAAEMHASWISCLE
jgi:hypothetical protein